MSRRLAGLTALVLASLITMTAAQSPRSPVADAAQAGNNAAIRALIQARADLDAPQVDGATALHWAVYWDDTELVDLLIRSGARATVANREGMTPRHGGALRQRGHHRQAAEGWRSC